MFYNYLADDCGSEKPIRQKVKKTLELLMAVFLIGVTLSLLLSRLHTSFATIMASLAGNCFIWQLIGRERGRKTGMCYTENNTRFK